MSSYGPVATVPPRVPEAMPARPPIAWRGLLITALLFSAALLATAARYGYHRDELYFLSIGRYPAFGYVDQPPLVPLVAHGMDVLSSHSLLLLRVPPALAGALVVLMTGLIAREFGSNSGQQTFAATTMAVSAILAGASHLASTTAFDLLGWSVMCWLAVRALRDGGPIWLALGACIGVASEVKTLVLFGAAALLVGVLVVGPRAALRSPWVAGAVAIAFLLWLPNLVWQAGHSWPQLSMSSAIATGSSGTSQPRWLFLPYQIVLVSPVLVPVWVSGLWRLFTDQGLRRWRGLAVGYVVLCAVFLVTAGKPYYLCGLYPVLLAAGAQPCWAWMQRGASRVRRSLLVAAVALSAVVSAVLMLPILPVSVVHATPVVAINYDAGETIGWPRFAATVAGVWDGLPATQRRTAVVLGGNYGETGALQRFRPDVPSYGVHNSMWDRRPPSSTATVIAVGFSRQRLAQWFGQVTPVARIDNGQRVDNDEQGRTVYLCTGLKQSWPALWPQLRRLG